VRSFPAEWKPTGRVWLSRLSPDGKVLAVRYQGVPGGLDPPGKPVVESEVKLWDVATGKEVAGPTPRWFDPEVMSFTADGKTMAVVVPQSGTTFEFRDTATGQGRGEFRGPADLTALALGPDGRVFTGTAEGTVLAWAPRAVKLPPSDQKRPAHGTPHHRERSGGALKGVPSFVRHSETYSAGYGRMAGRGGRDRGPPGRAGPSGRRARSAHRGRPPAGRRRSP
jgi:hypothetical protein